MKLQKREGLLILEPTGDEQVVNFQNPKTSTRPGESPTVKGVVVHYTAVHAASRKPERLAVFDKLLDGQEFENVRSFVEEQGRIPSGLMISLGNANKPARKASWDITVGKDGLVVQCNLKPTTDATWHAGRSLNGYVEKFGSRDMKDHRGTLVYDGVTKAFVAPVFPDGSVMGSGNTYTIGIELENWGRVFKKNGVFCRKVKGGYKSVGLQSHEVLKVGRRYYERVSDAQYRALLGVARALRDHYNIPESSWFSHADIVPDRRVDPDPPLDMEHFVEDLYADRAELFSPAPETDDFEEEYELEPSLFCELLDD